MHQNYEMSSNGLPCLVLGGPHGEGGEGEKPFGSSEGEWLPFQARMAVLSLVVVGGPARDI